MNRINLISDTVTKPTSDMLKAMAAAEVGDDVFKADPTINKLQKMASEMFGKDDALFCPSGTMTNQIAINCHTQALDEVICDITSHIYQYETGGYAFNSGLAIKLLQGENGKLTVDQVASAINQDYDWLPRSKLVVLENTCNKGGGTIYTTEEIAPISKFCSQNNLKIHLDGARLFNALVETKETPQMVGELFDSISICLSKGLGAPVGSLLIGNKRFIKQARRLRKVMGGGMRQAGFLAAAGIYALENNIERLKIDNDRAKLIGSILTNQHYVKNIKPVQSNILIFDLQDSIEGDAFIKELSNHGVDAVQFGPKTIRFTFHLDIKEDQVLQLIDVIKNIHL